MQADSTATSANAQPRGIEYCVHSSAWIAYLSGSKQATEIIENKTLCTSEFTLLEVIAWLSNRRQSDRDIRQALAFINAKALPIPATTELIAEAANRRTKAKNVDLDLFDWVHLGTAEQEGAMFLTADPKFSAMKNVDVLSDI